jgi:hypothetical protein
MISIFITLLQTTGYDLICKNKEMTGFMTVM